MNLNRRVGKLENKLLPGNGVTAIELEKDESEDQAVQRYCAAEGISVDKLNAQSKMIVFLVTDFGD